MLCFFHPVGGNILYLQLLVLLLLLGYQDFINHFFIISILSVLSFTYSNNFACNDSLFGCGLPLKLILMFILDNPSIIYSVGVININCFSFSEIILESLTSISSCAFCCSFLTFLSNHYIRLYVLILYFFLVY